MCSPTTEILTPCQKVIQQCQWEVKNAQNFAPLGLPMLVLCTKVIWLIQSQRRVFREHWAFLTLIKWRKQILISTHKITPHKEPRWQQIATNSDIKFSNMRQKSAICEHNEISRDRFKFGAAPRYPRVFARKRQFHGPYQRLSRKENHPPASFCEDKNGIKSGVLSEVLGHKAVKETAASRDNCVCYSIALWAIPENRGIQQMEINACP